MGVGAFIFVSGWIQIAAAFFIVLWQHWQSRQAVATRQGTPAALISDSDIAQQSESYEKAAGRLVVLPVCHFTVFHLWTPRDSSVCRFIFACCGCSRLPICIKVSSA